jgi:hypothetical protein
MQTVFWFLSTWQAMDVAHMLWRPLLAMLALYHSGDVFIVAGLLCRRFLPGRLSTGPLPDAVVLVPTLLASRDDLEKLQSAVLSVLTNGYPGRLTVVVAVDEAARAPTLAAELGLFLAHVERPGLARTLLVPVPRRVGKALAMEHGLERLRALVASGAVGAMPPLFFNLDADSALGPRALEHMARRLTTPRGLFGERPMIVASNVRVRPSHRWRGWRHFLTMRGQLALQVAREYAAFIAIGRHTARLMPVTGVSGALYATWTRLHLEAPYFGRFLTTLRWRDWGRWWLGRGAPRYEPSRLEPHLAAGIGPGDDTWVAWLAMGARWKGDRLDLALPATPWQALVELVRGFISRPIAYEPLGVVATSTPVTVKALFKQRKRWNSSRLWLVQRRGLSLFFSWSVGAFVLVDLGLMLATQLVTAAGLLVWPFLARPSMWLPMALAVQLVFLALQAKTTLLAMAQDEELRDPRLLLALPLCGLFHQVFNVGTAVVGLWQDVLGRGVDTGFAPAASLEANGTGRLALGYRLGRALRLAWRALVKGDVPLGWFWLGWHETRWTANGYRGWSAPRPGAVVVRERTPEAGRGTEVPAVEPVPAREAATVDGRPGGEA